jgi:hypothetical protein
MTLIDGPERQYLLNLVKKRMSFMYGDAHGIAYVLEPSLLGYGHDPRSANRSRAYDIQSSYFGTFDSRIAGGNGA